MEINKNNIKMAKNKNKEIKSIGLMTVLGWIFGILFILSGLGNLFINVGIGICLILAGIIILPYTNGILKNNFNISLSRGLRIFIALILIFASISLYTFYESSGYGREAKQNLNEGFKQTTKNIAEPIKENVETTKEENLSENIKSSSKVETTSTSVIEESKKITLGEKNALSKAKIYLNTMAFSEKGLIQQLEFEGFTTEQAEYGVENCGANWNEQATLKAKTYLNTMAFSKEGLIHQLEFEGFTTSQAEYGVENNDVDWNEQAALKAKTYLNIMAFSKEGLIQQLEFDRFTTNQAEYGVKAAGYK